MIFRDFNANEVAKQNNETMDSDNETDLYDNDVPSTLPDDKVFTMFFFCITKWAPDVHVPKGHPEEDVLLGPNADVLSCDVS